MVYTRVNAFSPCRVLLFSLISAILIGSMLLSLPISHAANISFIDLIFTSTSAICVTGLSTIPFESFTHFGQAIILILIQIGGLGLITLLLFTFSIFTNLGLSTQVVAGELLSLNSWCKVKDMLLFIVSTTFLIEIIGAILIFNSTHNAFASKNQAIFFSIFHSVSSFCNSGITILPMSIQTFSSNNAFLIISSILMVLGGIGFLSLREILYRLNKSEDEKKCCLSLQTKIIIFFTIFLFVINTIIFFCLESNHSLASMDGFSQLIASSFFAISSRSGGFLQVFSSNLTIATLMVFLVNSFIGWAPGSTGSGIKFTTFSIFIATLLAVIKGKTIVTIKGRSIALDQVFKSMAIVSLWFVWAIVATFILTITESNWNFFDIVIQVCSSLSNLGISTCDNSTLSEIGKVSIIITMFIGRVGALTLMIAFKSKNETKEFSYPEERIMIS